MESFQTAFKDLVMDRTIEVANKVLCTNKELRDIEKKIYELYSEIEKLLPDNMKYLILEHEEQVVASAALSEIIFYEQGLKDGAELIKILGLI